MHGTKTLLQTTLKYELEHRQNYICSSQPTLYIIYNIGTANTTAPIIPAKLSSNKAPRSKNVSEVSTHASNSMNVPTNFKPLLFMINPVTAPLLYVFGGPGDAFPESGITVK